MPDAIPSTGPRRRVLLQGAAWTVPVVAVAVAAPLAAASDPGDTTITPTHASLFAGECSLVDGLVFTVTSVPGGAPAANVAVAVTLPTGWTWDSAGTNPRTFLTDANGGVTVTDARAGSSGTGTVYAQVLPTGPTAAVSVTVTGAIAREAAASPNVGSIRDMGVPLDSTAIAWNIFLAPNGDLYSFHESTGYTIVDSGVTSVAAQHYRGPSGATTIEAELVSYVAGGVAKTYISEQNSTPAPGITGPVPSGTKSVGWNSFLYPNGNLYHGTTLIAAGVTSAEVQHYWSSGSGVQDMITYVNGTGLHTGRFNGVYTAANDFTSVPAGSTVVGWNSALAPNGTLYYQNGSIATAVVSASAQHAGDTAGASEQDLVTWVTSSGSGNTRTFGFGASSQTFTQPFGSNAKVVGWRTFLTAGRRLHLGNTLLDTNVLSADTFHEPGRTTPPVLTDWVAWTKATSCFA